VTETAAAVEQSEEIEISSLSTIKVLIKNYLLPHPQTKLTAARTPNSRLLSMIIDNVPFKFELVGGRSRECRWSLNLRLISDNVRTIKGTGGI